MWPPTPTRWGCATGWSTSRAKFAAGSLGLAAFDFARNGYEGTWNGQEVSAAVHSSRVLHEAWEVSVADPALAARWDSLEALPPDRLGRKVWELYQARGFTFPGTPGSAPPLLAQHDWVHVLADYGTTVEAEVEVFGLIARANDDMHAFSLLAMVISLFETGYLATGAGLFESSPGHLSASPTMAVRLADAMRRGALCHDRETGPTASTSSAWTGSPWPTGPARTSAPASASCRSQRRRSRRGPLGPGSPEGSAPSR